MRRPSRYVWVLGGSLALAFLLAVVCHAGFAPAVPAGMSAPPAPAPSFESAPAAKLLQSQFDWNGQPLGWSAPSPDFTAVRSQAPAGPAPETVPPHYGPLHRRPPPSFS